MSSKVIIALLIVIVCGGSLLYENYEHRREYKEFLESNRKHDLEWIEYRKDYIKKNAPSTQSALFLISLGDDVDGKNMLEKLILTNDDSAKFAKFDLQYKGEVFSKNKEKALSGLNKLCLVYIEPCRILGDIYKADDKHDMALELYKRSASNNDIESYGKLYELYSSKKWRRANESLAKKYAEKMNDAKEFKTLTQYSLNKHIN